MRSPMHLFEVYCWLSIIVFVTAVVWAVRCHHRNPSGGYGGQLIMWLVVAVVPALILGMIASYSDTGSIVAIAILAFIESQMIRFMRD